MGKLSTSPSKKKEISTPFLSRYGFVEFADIRNAEEALIENEKEFMGRLIRVELANKNKKKYDNNYDNRGSRDNYRSRGDNGYRRNSRYLLILQNLNLGKDTEAEVETEMSVKEETDRVGADQEADPGKEETPVIIETISEEIQEIDVNLFEKKI